MANTATSSPGLSLPRETSATLTPGQFLHAHLKRKDPIRPDGRTPEEFRQAVVNTGSLTHSKGSAVVRAGDTAVVCGIRPEVLLASEVPHPPPDDLSERDLVEEVGLLVPNLELSTGCSSAHLPGNPPGSLAQSLSHRILTLLHTSNLISAHDLCISYTLPPVEDDVSEQGSDIVTKAYWTLYIDILCIALDGNAFDVAWAAVLAALRNTTLPKAWWDPDREMILCSPLTSDSRGLRLDGLPIATSCSVFSTASPLKRRDEAESWVLADPNGFEEDVCRERVTIVIMRRAVGRGEIIMVDKHGGGVIGGETMTKCVELAQDGWSHWEVALRGS